MYRIANWEHDYEVNDKGRDWRPGQPKRVGPLEYVRLQVHGKALSLGFRRLRRASGEENMLRNFGLFCKLLEMAAAAQREDRNCLPDAGEIADILDLPLAQIEQALTSLCDAGWIAEIPESPGIPESPPNQRTNETKPTQHNPTNGREISRWESVRRSIEIEFASDRGIARLLAYTGNRMISEPDETIDHIAGQLESLLAESRDKDHPVRWFQTYAGMAVGYQNGKGSR